MKNKYREGNNHKAIHKKNRIIITEMLIKMLKMTLIHRENKQGILKSA